MASRPASSSSATRRLLPMPGTPTSVTSCGSRSRAHASSAPASSATSSLAADELGARLARRRRRRTATVRVDRLPGRHRLRLALGVDGSARAVLDRVRGRAVRRLADEDAVHRRGGLQARGRVDDVACDHRLARCDRSRRARRAPRPCGRRCARRRSDSAATSRIASAARTARSGSSSCATGAPKTAMTASPMNFSTVPPWRSSSCRSRA